MIRHILKIIWNERRSNLWILLEYTLVFSVLWFCCDYCSAILRTYKSDPGIDIRDTYRIEMGYRIIKNTDEPEPEYDRFALTMTFLERVKRHPDVAYVALGRYAIPYSGSVATSGWMLNDEKGTLSDSAEVGFRERLVTPDFFRVFNIPIRSGRMFRWPDDGENKNVIISTIGPGVCGIGEERFPIDKIRTLSQCLPGGDENVITAIGTTEQIHDIYWGKPMSTIYYPLSREQTSLYRNEIALRVKPGTDKDFPQRFRKEMSEQLKLGPYFLASVKPISDYKAKQAEEVNGELNGVYSANEFLTRSNLMKAYLPTSKTPIRTGKKVAVVGGGNVAMDAARSALRLGAESVYIVYRRGMAELPARKEEVEHAEEEGIIFKTLCNPVAIHPDEDGFVHSMTCIEMELGEPDASGRRRPIEKPGSEFELEVDTVIMSLGTSPNPLIRSTTPGLETNKHGCIVTEGDEGKTSRDGVYAGGDAVTGAATVIKAMGAGKAAAKAMDEYIRNK